MTAPRFEQSGEASGRILVGSEEIAQIRDMCLCRLRLRSLGQMVIGDDVPLPLYWRQYAHHEDPERNCGYSPHVTPIPASGERLILRCEGTNAPGEIRSRYHLEVRRDARPDSYVVEIHARLDVLEGKTWRVTFNPSHGELEFCNLYVEGSFVREQAKRKIYSACFVERGPSVSLIAHHHLESSDKHNILLRQGDRFGWLLEEENPVLELLSHDEVSAGLCAYMWDAHLAYRLCAEPGERFVSSGAPHEASWRISSMSRREGEALLERAVTENPPELDATPVYVHGLNTFRETLRSFGATMDRLWPWAFEVVHGREDRVRGMVDRACGYDDSSSLRITAEEAGTARWLATTLGPAFGDAPFASGKKYRLTVMVRTDELMGLARVGLRLHREGSPGLGETALYEHFWSEKACTGTSPWTAIQVLTPAITPPPDRLHLVLHHEGRGTSWFDNLRLEHDE